MFRNFSSSMTSRIMLNLNGTDIPNPVVTPAVLDVIKSVTDTLKSLIITNLEIQLELIQAGDYLNMDYLQALGDPNFQAMRELYPFPSSN